MKGVPLRMEVGPRDIENDTVVLVRRDLGEKMFLLKKYFNGTKKLYQTIM